MPICEKGKIAEALDLVEPTIIVAPEPAIIVAPIEFYVIEEELTWHDSVSACEANGDHLTSINNPNEQSKVTSALEETFDKPENMKFWIGLNKEAGGHNEFKWTDNSALDYNNWDTNQPGAESANEDCVAIGWGNGMKWHDVGCQKKMMPICEAGTIEGPEGPPRTVTIEVPVPAVSDKYYVIKTEKLTWDDAENACAQNGDHLTAVTSQEETHDINNVLNSAFPNPKKEKFWIGLHE